MKIFRVSGSKLTKIFQLDRRWVRTMCRVMLVESREAVVFWIRSSRRSLMEHLSASKILKIPLPIIGVTSVSQTSCKMKVVFVGFSSVYFVHICLYLT